MIETMTHHMGIEGLLILFAAFQGLLLTVAFGFRSRGDAWANRILAGLVLCLTVHLLEIFMLLAGLTPYAPHFAGATFPLAFAIGPLYHAYVRRLTDPGWRLRWIDLLHLAPLVLCAVINTRWWMAPVELKLQYGEIMANRIPFEPGWRSILLLSINLAQYVVYASLSIRRVRRLEARVKELAADNELAETVRGLRRMTIAFGGYVTLYAGIFAALQVFEGYGATVDLAWLVILAGFLILHGMQAMGRPETFTHRVAWMTHPSPPTAETPAPPPPGRTRPRPRGPEPVTDPDPRPALALVPGADPDGVAAVDDGTTIEGREHSGTSPKYARSALSDDAVKRVVIRLQAHLAEDRPYLDGSLRLADVARSVGATTHHLSQAINQELGRSFFDLVNEYRVEEAQRLLADPARDTHTILAIAYDAGFNTKSAFNAAFKKRTGQTPSAYRKALHTARDVNDRPDAPPRDRAPGASAAPSPPA